MNSRRGRLLARRTMPHSQSTSRPPSETPLPRAWPSWTKTPPPSCERRAWRVRSQTLRFSPRCRESPRPSRGVPRSARAGADRGVGRCPVCLRESPPRSCLSRANRCSPGAGAGCVSVISPRSRARRHRFSAAPRPAARRRASTRCVRGSPTRRGAGAGARGETHGGHCDPYRRASRRRRSGEASSPGAHAPEGTSCGAMNCRVGPGNWSVLGRLARSCQATPGREASR